MRKPDNAGKDVAKSLHTVTVLYQVAGLILRANFAETAADAIDLAMIELELANRPDPHGLRARAFALLTTGDT